ncbi:hypothetical protein [Microbacterium sp. NPDC077184]|uniref:hypothetical protein n=1 Tax=Microbacterium sp. NPDC077184 TaxID=3154764 RepID=UPI00343E60A9
MVPTRATDEARAAFVQAVRDNDILASLTSTPDADLIQLGAGLAVEAYEGRWGAAVAIAQAFYRIPADVLELLAAAYLAHVAPGMGAALLLRPNEATIADLRGILARAGHNYTTGHRAP